MRLIILCTTIFKKLVYISFILQLIDTKRARIHCKQWISWLFIFAKKHSVFSYFFVLDKIFFRKVIDLSNLRFPRSTSQSLLVEQITQTSVNFVQAILNCLFCDSKFGCHINLRHTFVEHFLNQPTLVVSQLLHQLKQFLNPWVS